MDVVKAGLMRWTAQKSKLKQNEATRSAISIDTETNTDWLV